MGSGTAPATVKILHKVLTHEYVVLLGLLPHISIIYHADLFAQNPKPVRFAYVVYLNRDALIW